MSEPIEFKNRIVEWLGVIPETSDIKRYPDSNQFWILEGEELSTTTDVKFLIYDCSQDGLNFNQDEFIRIYNQEIKTSFFSLVMVFNDLDEESKTRAEVYKNLKIADEKKFINKCFDEKIGIYISRPEIIEIEVEQDGINFLEYETEVAREDNNVNYLNGYIYNISYQELRNVFNVTGRKLFCENVRVGLSNHKIGKKIGKSFKDYIKVGVYYELIKEKEYERQSEKILEELGLSEDKNILKLNSPDKFWFYHNGVTIFSSDATKIDRSNNRIKLKPSKISIINGAQTITNFYNGVNELQTDFTNLSEKLGINLKYGNEWLEKCITNVCNKIKIKTIIIDGFDEFVKEISKGLNTQIPIQEETILAVSPIVAKINNLLKSKGISITRDGEVSTEINLSVLQYVKKYLIITGEPGKSKNLNKTELESLLDKSSEICADNNFPNRLKLLTELDEWWKGTRLTDIFLNEENKEDIEYFRYGKNYFGSYLICKEISEVDEENLYNLFNQFVNEFKIIKEKVSIEDFKDDSLYKEFIKTRAFSNVQTTKNKSLSSIIKEDLRQYLNQNVNSKYAVSRVISDYLKVEGITIPYFRVIAVNDKEIKEAYPFPNRTFTELYQSEEKEESVSKIEFEDSEFYKEIKKVFPVFVVKWNKDANEVVEVKIIDDFSFKNYEQEAKQVFNETKEAFKEGNESLFIKSSAGKKFHIRPKAINRDDTFEFSNGMQITKRTFWANKETVKEIIEKVK